MSLTSRLRELRAGRSMSALAQLFTENGFSCTRQYIWQVESGRRGPSVEMLDAYRRVFGVDGESLLKLAARDRRASRLEQATDASPVPDSGSESCIEIAGAA